MGPAFRGVEDGEVSDLMFGGPHVCTGKMIFLFSPNRSLSQDAHHSDLYHSFFHFHFLSLSNDIRVREQSRGKKTKRSDFYVGDGAVDILCFYLFSRCCA